MAQNNRNGEVSEVIFGVRNRLDALNCFARSRAHSVFCVRNLSAHKCSLSTLRGSRNLFGICRKSCACRCLDLFCRWLASARLARLGEVMVLGITSPSKPMKTLGFLAKARLARLFLPMPTHVRAHVRTRRSTSFAYRKWLEITSLNLANLASGFCPSVSDQRVFPTTYDVAQSRETNSISPLTASLQHRATRTLQWPHDASAKVALRCDVFTLSHGSSHEKPLFRGAWER